ncbi:uncharacterized protein LOC144720617 [Lampetra planeri]
MNIAMSTLCLMLFIVHAKAQESVKPPQKERLDPDAILTFLEKCVALYKSVKDFTNRYTCEAGMGEKLSTVRCPPGQESCVTASVTVGVNTFTYKSCASDLDCVFIERIRKMVLNDVVDAYEDARGCILNSVQCSSAPRT